MLATYLVSAQEKNFMSYEQALVGSNLHFKMVPIQGGTFLIGSAENEKEEMQMKDHKRKLPLMLFG